MSADTTTCGIDFRLVVCLDLETALIRTYVPQPPVVICSLYRPATGPLLYGTFELEEQVEKILRSDLIIVGHNIAYDMLCLCVWYPALIPLIVSKYNRNQILDTMLAQRVVEISTGDMRGQLALDRLCARYGIEMKNKHSVDEDGEPIRLGFGKYWGQPASVLNAQEWAYCADDVVDCWELFHRIWRKAWCTQRDVGKLARTAFSLQMISGYGLRADANATAELEIEAKAIIDATSEVMIEWGLMRRDRDGSVHKNLQVIQTAVAEAYGLDVFYGEGRNRNKLYVADPDRAPLGLVTDTGAVGTGRMGLFESGDPILMRLADLQEWMAVLNKDLKIFRDGIFHTRFGFANTLRTTSSKPNIQNFRKKAGIRECIYPFFGAFVAADYVGLENGTLAQCVVNYTGRRTFADQISSGWDKHCEIGALIMGCSYQDFQDRLAAEESDVSLLDEARHYKHARGAAKPANFGLPGYMTNPKTFQSYALLSYGVRMTLDQAQRIMAYWWETQHDQMAYLAHVDTFKDGPERFALYSVPIPNTDIVRRGATRTAAANTGFQGLGMQTAADALWLVTVEYLLGRFPGRLAAFVHDELITDCCPEAIEVVRIILETKMIEAAEMNLPDVRMRVECIAMDRMSKVAKHKVDKRTGRLILQRIVRNEAGKYVALAA